MLFGLQYVLCHSMGGKQACCCCLWWWGKLVREWRCLYRMGMELGRGHMLDKRNEDKQKSQEKSQPAEHGAVWCSGESFGYKYTEVPTLNPTVSCWVKW